MDVPDPAPSPMPRHPAPHLRRLPALLAALSVAACATLTAGPAHALWSSNPAVGTLVCGADGDQWPLVPVSDKAGGVIVLWVDGRGGVSSNGIYAQRLDAFGRPLWSANGIVLIAGTKILQPLAAAPDGNGGVVVAWSESRSGATPAIYAQHLDVNGTQLWTPAGVRVCVSAAAQRGAAITSDGAGGAFVAWFDAAGDSEVVVRRLDARGAPQWGANGVTLSAAGLRDLRPRIASDGAGGAIVAWTRGTGLAARRIAADGTPLWPARYEQPGVALTDLQPDGAGGALLAWTRAYTVSGVARQDAVVQRLDTNGAEYWNPGGLVLDTSNYVYKPQVLADGVGGAFAVWEHATSTTASLVRAQKVASVGIANWTAGGIPVCPGGAGQYTPHLIPDGAGGIEMVFEDYRSGVRYDVYGQRLDGSGNLLWGSGGAAVCTAPGSGVGEALIVPGANASMIAAWDDFRALFFESDLSATRVLATGGMGPTAVEPGRPVSSGTLALSAPYPQPARGAVTFHWHGAGGGAGRLELFDPGGRRVRSLDLPLDAAEGAATLALTDDAGVPLPVGAYHARLRSPDGWTSVPVIVVR